MDSLSEQLQSLGVRLGGKEIKRSDRARFKIERVVAGEMRETPYGEVFTVQQNYASGFNHGGVVLRAKRPPGIVTDYMGSPDLDINGPESLVFLDTETTGLAGGTGTMVFLIGVGHFSAQGFELTQFFVRDPSEEPAVLSAVDSFLTPFEIVVSFNGKAYDLPLLKSRYILNGAKDPLKFRGHLDMLFLARRLWRDRLPSRALADLERDILRVERNEQDVPGWLIPQIYFDYVQTGDARPLKSVFYHNAMDVVSLAALYSHTAHILDDPVSQLDSRRAVDLTAIGKLCEDIGRADQAIAIYQRSFEHDLPEPTHSEVLKRLAFLHKRRGDYHAAVQLWEQAVRRGHIYAYIELAKYYEHRVRDYQRALKWADAALDESDRLDTQTLEPGCQRGDILHRLDRLERKLRS